MRARGLAWSGLLRGLGLALLLLACCAALRCPCRAAEDGYTVTVRSAEATRIRYSVSAPRAGQALLAVTAGYRNGRLLETRLDPFTSGDEAHEGDAALTEAYDDFKVLLLDAQTYAPLCPYGGWRTVRFLDEAGELLESRRVLSGHGAAPPEAPEKEGYCFLGWDGDWDKVFEDLSLRPRYVPADSANLFLLSSADAAPGDSVTVRLELAGTVSLCGFDFRLCYDGQALEYLSMDREFAFDLAANHVAEGHYIRLNYSDRQNRTRGGTVLELCFRVREGGMDGTALTLQPVKVVAIDPDRPVEENIVNVEYSVNEGVIRIS